jgi:pectinesterase
MKVKFLLLLIFGLAQGYVQSQNLFADLADQIDITVARDGSGNYTTIQSAIDAVPDNSTDRTVVFIKNGIYIEKVVIPSTKTNLTLVGEDVNQTILSWNEAVAVQWVRENNVILEGPHTAPTLIVDANDFMMLNLTVENSYGYQYAGPQALAIRTAGDRQVFLHCKFFSYQDTYMTFGRSRNYTKDCLIEGAVDFIFGTGVNVFDSCIFNSIRNGGYYTAASTDANWDFGYVIRDTRLTSAAGNANQSLGRTWSNTTKCVFYQCDLNNIVSSQAWFKWADQIDIDFNVAEYKSINQGNIDNRPTYSKQMGDAEAARYTLSNIFAKTVPAAPYADYESNWLPDVDNDPIYKVLKKHTSKYLNDSDMDNAKLSAIWMGEQLVSNFNSDILKFAVNLTDTVPPILYAKTAVIGAIYQYKPPAALPGFGTILVTSANRKFSNTYEVFLDNNGTYPNAKLTKITVGTDSILMQDGVFDYAYNLSDSVYEAFQNRAKIDIRARGNVSGSLATYNKYKLDKVPDTIRISVTAPDKITINEYKVYINLPQSILKSNENGREIWFENPFRDTLIGEIQVLKSTKIKVEIFDMSGVKVMDKVYKYLNGGKVQIAMNTAGLSKGIYVYKIYADKMIHSGKLVRED